ncbi:MAG: HIT domain-containing protein [Candidatus Levybacteria bacterium]|nr:HIT domain-containing protein [Candidatus Levybacteria bacterium]
MAGCIFCKIRDREIPKDFTYEDENVMVFADINPLKPIHLLVVSKQHVQDLLNAEEKLLGRLMTIIKKMAKEQKLEGKGFRVINHGGGAQIIDHLHFHLLGPIGKHAAM